MCHDKLWKWPDYGDIWAWSLTFETSAHSRCYVIVLYRALQIDIYLLTYCTYLSGKTDGNEQGFVLSYDTVLLLLLFFSMLEYTEG